LELSNYSGSDKSESIKSELNREIGKILEPKLKKEVDFNNKVIELFLLIGSSRNQIKKRSNL